MIEPTLRILNGCILVEFEERPKLNKALDLVAPERFLVQEAEEEGETDAYAVTTDRRTINPQTVRVIKGNQSIPDGSRCFVHYGCYEIAQWYNETQAIIRADMVFFLLDPIRPLAGTYLAEEIFIEGDKTDSGIYTTPVAEMKLPCNVRITHTPVTKGMGMSIDILRLIDDMAYVEKIKREAPISAGDEVITIDGNQYTLKYDDKKYIKLRESEIIAKVIGDEIVPLGKYIVVGYDETYVSPELQAENDRKAFSKDFAIKNRLFVPGIDFEAYVPKYVDATLLSVGDGITLNHLYADRGDRLYVRRNAGVALKGDKWIIKLDDIVFVYGKEETA